MSDNKECPTCGSTPMGSGCYHICPNSDSYYSPEQERYDDQFYGEDDVRERYAGEIDPEYEDYCAMQADMDDGPDYGYGEARAIADSTHPRDCVSNDEGIERDNYTETRW